MTSLLFKPPKVPNLPTPPQAQKVEIAAERRKKQAQVQSEQVPTILTSGQGLTPGKTILGG